MPRIGPMELVLILLVLLLVFGPGRLPEIGGAIGRGIREFRQSVSERSSDETEATEKASDE